MSNNILMFYTEKAGLSNEGVKKLKGAGITAVKIADVKEISFPHPANVEWLSLRDEISVLMLQALSRQSYGPSTFGDLIISAMKKKAGIDQNVQPPQPKKTA